MVLDATLLNTQLYKVRIKGKVEQSRESSSAFPLHLGAVAIEKGAFGSPSTMVANLLEICIYLFLLTLDIYLFIVIYLFIHTYMGCLFIY